MIFLEYENNKENCNTGCDGSWEQTKFRIKQRKVQISAETNTWAVVLLDSLAYVMTSLSIIMMGIWEILRHSFPFFLRYRFFSKGQFQISRVEREAGKPSSGKHCSLSQYPICNSLSEVRCWNPFPLSDVSCGNEMVRRIREGGNDASSRKEPTSLPSYQILISERVKTL